MYNELSEVGVGGRLLNNIQKLNEFHMSGKGTRSKISVPFGQLILQAIQPSNFPRGNPPPTGPLSLPPLGQLRRAAAAAVPMAVRAQSCVCCSTRLMPKSPTSLPRSPSRAVYVGHLPEFRS